MSHLENEWVGPEAWGEDVAKLGSEQPQVGKRERERETRGGLGWGGVDLGQPYEV